MMVMKKMAALMAGVGLLASGSAQAALENRGGGLLYDTVLNVTWLQDANYAKTSGYDSDGLMNWSAANTWASSLNISRFAGESLTGWRLPTALNQDGSGPCLGYSCTSSEMGHMFYNNMGASATNSIFSGTNSTNLALFTNLQPHPYQLLGTAFVPRPDITLYFNNADGVQNYGSQNDEWNAWAVRPGDVAAVPEPEAYALLMAGLGMLGIVGGRKKKLN